MAEWAAPLQFSTAVKKTGGVFLFSFSLEVLQAHLGVCGRLPVVDLGDGRQLCAERRHLGRKEGLGVDLGRGGGVVHLLWDGGGARGLGGRALLVAGSCGALLFIVVCSRAGREAQVSDLLGAVEQGRQALLDFSDLI